jgi:phenol hydroxylase P4 protein
MTVARMSEAPSAARHPPTHRMNPNKLQETDMSVQSVRPFKPVPKDVAAHFHGQWVVYFCWDHHLMFYAPVAKLLSPTLSFQEVIDTELTATYRPHPDFARIDWAAVQWIKDGAPFTPALDKSLAQNGLTHKSAIHFITPGLNGINGSGF